jgi:hypothetical protein
MKFGIKLFYFSLLAICAILLNSEVHAYSSVQGWTRELLVCKCNGNLVAYGSSCDRSASGRCLENDCPRCDDPVQ